MNLEERVVQLVARTTGKDASRIGRTTAMVADLGMDSAAALVLLVELEDTFDLSLSDRIAARMRTVGDIIDHLQELTETK
jgi:acyl carrier protein